MSTISERRQTENEAMFRQANEKVQKKLKKMLPEDEYASLELYFYCECADETCAERIVMTPERYQVLHKKRDYFIIRPGHQRSQIERLVNKLSDYYTVQKFLTPPENPSKLHST